MVLNEKSNLLLEEPKLAFLNLNPTHPSAINLIQLTNKTTIILGRVFDRDLRICMEFLKQPQSSKLVKIRQKTRKNLMEKSFLRKHLKNL